MNRGKFMTLVWREIREYRSLWAAPVIAAFGVIATSVVGAISMDAGKYGMFKSPASGFVPTADFAGRTLIKLASFVGMIAAIALGNYLLECLYAERRDRSILFWKSLPVSDAETVLSKLFVALVLVPLGVLMLVVVLHPVSILIGFSWFPGSHSLADWLQPAAAAAAVGRLFIAWLYGVLWYLPAVGYLMLASVIARRTPLLYAALPIVIAALWDGLVNNLLLQNKGHSVTLFLIRRFAGGDGAQANLLRADGNHWLPFHDPALWIGVAVGTGMLYTVIRLRRYRDDT